jgi:DNA-binding GntR family transcriptional regulator
MISSPHGIDARATVVPASVPKERNGRGVPTRNAGLASTAKKAVPKGRDGARQSLVHKAYGDLKHGILTNRYPPGFQATETEIAEREGMSRTPMHEALLRLQSDGLVELMPRHGVRVLPIYPADLREIYELLCCLEAMAAELLANRQLPPDAPEFREMEAANVAIDDALARGDLDAFAEMDDRFHRLLVTYCGNGRLMRSALSISDQQHRARMLTLRLRPLPTGTSSEHRAILEAIQRGDARAAHELHRAHRVRGMNLIIGLIEHYLLGHL